MMLHLLQSKRSEQNWVDTLDLTRLCASLDTHNPELGFAPPPLGWGVVFHHKNGSERKLKAVLFFSRILPAFLTITTGSPIIIMPVTNDLATPIVPRGLRVLGTADIQRSSGSAPDYGQQLKNEAAAIERWWSQPRWQHTKRVYSGT